jgi:hypothetical protein
MPKAGCLGSELRVIWKGNVIARLEFSPGNVKNQSVGAKEQEGEKCVGGLMSRGPVLFRLRSRRDFSVFPGDQACCVRG